jgi:Ca2+-binding RTX toxin-like protein
MTINVVGEVFTGTHFADNLGPGFGDDLYVMTADNFVTDTINGGHGSDTVDYSPSDVGVTITLTDQTTAGGPTGGTVEADFAMKLFVPDFPPSFPGPSGHYVDFTHHQLVANLTSIENATGSAHDDVLIGNSQNNILEGGGGRDILTGGGGDDTFVFRHASDSPAQPLGPNFLQSVDRITDFTPGHDHIDLRGLANETAGHAPLTFHDGGFTGVAGEITEAFTSNGTAEGTGFIVAADLNGDAHADFEIFVNVTASHTRLVQSDFVL